MKRDYLIVFVRLFISLLASSPSGATTLNISAGPSGWGCTTSYGGPTIFGNGPGDVVTLTKTGETGPLQLTLAAGTYSIANAAPTGLYSAWRYDGGNDWAWNSIIGKDICNNQAQVLDVGWGRGGIHYDSAAAITSATLSTYRFETVLNPSTTLPTITTQLPWLGQRRSTSLLLTAISTTTLAA